MPFYQARNLYKVCTRHRFDAYPKVPVHSSDLRLHEVFTPDEKGRQILSHGSPSMDALRKSVTEA